MPRNSDLLERESRSLDDEVDRRPRRRRAVSQPEWFDTQQAKPGKDVWDKVAAIAPIVSGALIFAMGGMCTYNYNQQQLRLQEIQTIEKFIPHLMGNEQSKRAAILAISSLTNAELAGKFAQIFASQGTVSALQSIAENGSEKEKNIAADALARAIEKSRNHDIQGGDKQTSSDTTQFPLTLGGGSDSDEAEKLENLAQICRDRGHMAACETLLKQASLLRLKAGSNENAIITLKKLAEVQQALGSKETDLTLHKIQSLTDGEKAVSAPLPPVKAPPEEPAVPVQMQHSELRTSDTRTDAAQASEPRLESPEDSSGQNPVRP